MRLELKIGQKFRDITGPVSDAFAAELDSAAMSKDFTEIILDFEGTRTINSMAMGALFTAYRKLKMEGRDMQIVNASDRVRHLLRMVNMAEILGVSGHD